MLLKENSLSYVVMLVSFKDLDGVEREIKHTHKSEYDYWYGYEIGDKAFDINTFDCDGNLKCSVYELVEKDKNGLWLLNNSIELEVNNIDVVDIIRY